MKLLFSFCFTFWLASALAQPRIDQLDSLIQQYHHNNLFSGNALVVVNGTPILEKSYGLANLEWTIAHQPYTKFRIGSITKQFTAMLIMQLKQQGKLELQHPITRYLPWYPKETGHKITIHQLLTHSSGLANYTGNAESINDINTHAYTPEEIARKYGAPSLEFEPGTKFRYCNTGYYLLGVIIETITRKSFADVLREAILQPVGMIDTGMDSPETILLNRAEGYTYSFDGYTNALFINPYFATFSAGAMYSTARDLSLWQTALMSHQLLSRENTELMLIPNLGNYGYGMYISKVKSGEPAQIRTVIGHNGGISGFSSSMLRYLEEDILVILLDNTRADRRGNLENITADIVNLLHNKPAAPVLSMQVAMIKKVNTSTGDDLVALYKILKVKKADFGLSGAESFFNSLGAYLLQQGRLNDAESFLKFATEEFPASSMHWAAYSEVLGKKGQITEAIQGYKRALELDPTNAKALAELKVLKP